MMKWIFPALLILSARDNSFPGVHVKKEPSGNKVWVVAHRGDWRNAPENSLRAFVSAADMGVDMVELDLKRTKDGELVILHDETLDRVSNGKGRPSDYTLEELKRFRLKNGLGRVGSNPIPTLKEVMTALKGRVMVNLDKSYPFYAEAMAVLRETGTLEQALFKSEAAYADVHSKYGGLIDSMQYMPVVDLDRPDARGMIEDYLVHMHPYAFELSFRRDSSAILSDNDFIRRTGARIWMNSLWASLNGGHDDDRAVEEADTEGSWGWLIAHGATIIQTDRPALLLQWLRQRKLHQ